MEALNTNAFVFVFVPISVARIAFSSWCYSDQTALYKVKFIIHVHR